MEFHSLPEKREEQQQNTPPNIYYPQQIYIITNLNEHAILVIDTGLYYSYGTWFRLVQEWSENDGEYFGIVSEGLPTAP